MAKEIKKVAFIGLGKMGSNMARNILTAGFDLNVYNRTQAKMKPLTDAGAKGMSSPKETVLGVDVVITNLMDDNSVRDIAMGENGLLAGLKREGIHIGTTTNSPALAKQLTRLHAAHGSSYLSLPVAGTPDVAGAGQLRAWVAGDPAAIERCMRLFDAFTASVIKAGTEPSAANTVKLINNFIGISVLELMGQVYTIGEKCGVDLEFLEDLCVGFFGGPFIKKYAKTIRTRNFDPAGFALIAGLKDLQLMLQVSTEMNAPIKFADIIKDKLLTALAHGMDQKDWSGIYEITRMDAGLK